MTEKELNEILELCRKSTQGPWISLIEGRDLTSGSSFIQTGDKEYDIEFCNIRKQDQDFIAMAKNVIPILVDEIIRLKFGKNNNTI